eukprot:COSAG01_NODE_102_length_26290_cov_94.760299_19_plen_61_part_00
MRYNVGRETVPWAQVREVIESLCMQLPRHGDSIIVCECAQVREVLRAEAEDEARHPTAET